MISFTHFELSENELKLKELKQSLVSEKTLFSFYFYHSLLLNKPNNTINY